MPEQTTRRRLSAGERRAGILDAALVVFAKGGYHGSSIDQIARTAGISKALIYEHFPSKDELHVELIQGHARELFARLAANASIAAGPARLEAGLDAYFSFVEERREAWRMLFLEATDPQIAAALDRVVSQVTTVVAGLIADDPRVGTADESRDDGVEMVAQMLVGAVQSLANWWADHQEVPRERVVKAAMELSWLGLDRLRAGERWRTATA